MIDNDLYNHNDDDQDDDEMMRQLSNYDLQLIYNDIIDIVFVDDKMK